MSEIWPTNNQVKENEFIKVCTADVSNNLHLCLRVFAYLEADFSIAVIALFIANKGERSLFWVSNKSLKFPGWIKAHIFFYSELTKVLPPDTISNVDSLPL